MVWSATGAAVSNGCGIGIFQDFYDNGTDVQAGKFLEQDQIEGLIRKKGTN